MWKWKVNFKIEARANPPMAARSPNRDLPMIAKLSLLTIVGRASAENLVISSGNRPVTEQSPSGGRQAPAGLLYSMVQGQENPTVSCRSRKIGIQQKSTGHRAIYVPWDIGFRVKLSLKECLSIRTVMWACGWNWTFIWVSCSVGRVVRVLKAKKSKLCRQLLLKFITFIFIFCSEE